MLNKIKKSLTTLILFSFTFTLIPSQAVALTTDKSQQTIPINSSNQGPSSSYHFSFDENWLSDIISPTYLLADITDPSAVNNQNDDKEPTIAKILKAPNITKEFKDWIKNNKLENKVNDYVTLINITMKKVDTLEECDELNPKLDEIFNLLKAKRDEMTGQLSTPHKVNMNDYAAITYLFDHFMAEKTRIASVCRFAKIFECLLIKAETGAEINGKYVPHEELIKHDNLACQPGPGETEGIDPHSGPYNVPTDISGNPGETSETPSTAYKNINKIVQKLVAFFQPAAKAQTTGQNIDYGEGTTTVPNSEIPEEGPVTDLYNDLQNQYGNQPPTDYQNVDKEKLPPPLEFSDPREKNILLPLTKEQELLNQKNHQTVEKRIYYLLYYVFRVLEQEGENYDRYQNDEVIQDASTPYEVKLYCWGKSLEDDPSSCLHVPPDFLNLCGFGSISYFIRILTDSVDNLGVPYKKRAHLKIWLGLDAPESSDEQMKPESGDQTPPSITNRHRDFKAVDISEIGLYNESVDCTVCRGLPPCKFISTIVNYESMLTDLQSGGILAPNNISITDPTPTNPGGIGTASNTQTNSFISKAYAQAGNPILGAALGIYKDSALCLTICAASIAFLQLPICIPCCPRILDKANKKTIPVKVQWQNENYSDTLSQLATQAMGNVLPIDQTNGFSLQSLLNGMAQNALQQLFSTHFQDFDVMSLMQGSFNSLMTNVGNQWLDEKIFGRLGLPEGFSSSVNWLNPDPQSLASNIVGGYLNDALDLENSSMIPVVAAAMSGDFKNAALNAINLTSDLKLPPQLQNAINIAVTNGDKPEAMALAFANIGLQKLNTDFFGFPEGTLDIGGFNEQGFAGLANRLGQTTLTKLAGLPPVNIDFQNPQNTAIAIAGNVLADKLPIQNLDPNLISNIASGNFDTRQILQAIPKEELANIFTFDQDPTQAADFMNKYLSGQTTLDQVSFLNELENRYKINYQSSGDRLGLSTDTIKDMVQYGTNPSLSREQTAGRVGLDILLNNTGLDISDSDKEQLLNKQYDGGLKDRINNQIASSEQTKRLAQSLANSSSYFPFTTDKSISNNELKNRPFKDTLKVDKPSGNDPLEITGALSSLTDLSSFKIVSLNDLNKLSQNSGTDNFELPEAQNIIPGEIYAAIPQIDNSTISSLFIPTSSDSLKTAGATSLLERMGNYTDLASKNPVTISPLDHQPTAAEQQEYQKGFENLFGNKFQVEYNYPSGQLAKFDTMLGASKYVFDTFQGMGGSTSPQDTIKRLSNVGNLFAAAQSVGLNSSEALNPNANIADLEKKLNGLANAMAVFDSMKTGNIQGSVQNIASFLKDNNILGNFDSNSSFNMGPDGTPIIEGVNVLNLINDFQSGNYVNALENIPAVQEKFNNLSTNIGVPLNQIFNIIQNPTADSIAQTSFDIITAHITEQTNLDKVQVAEIITNTVGIPPDPSKIPNLLTNPTLQEKLFSDIDPEMLGDISNIYGMVMSGNITPQTAANTIMNANFFQNMIGKEEYANFMSQYGGMVNAALTGDPQAIAQAALSQYSGQIDSWLSNSGLDGIINMNGLNQLLNGDVQGFIQDTALNYINNELIAGLDPALGGLLSNSIMGILNGDIPYEAIAGYVLPYINDIFGNMPGLTEGLDITGFDPGDAALSQVGSMAEGMISSFFFKKCRKKIAQDNITHLTDIILSFDRSPEAQEEYITPQMNELDTAVTAITDANGKVTDQYVGDLQNFYPLKIFSDFASSIQKKINLKGSTKFDWIWLPDRIKEQVNVLVINCDNRQNRYLKKCEDAIHVSF